MPDPRPAAADALRLASRRFQAAERIDMSALAADVGVNRVTLYRWVGSREQLLVEIVWQLAERTLDRIAADLADEPRGAERAVATITRFLGAAIANPGMQRWLADEGEVAMRLLTRRDTGFQPRLIDRVHALLVAEEVSVEADLREVAYVIVRVIESYTYLDLILGEPPEAGRAEPILRLLLR
jgi:AcrR family transcriptional regulator